MVFKGCYGAQRSELDDPALQWPVVSWVLSDWLSPPEALPPVVEALLDEPPQATSPKQHNKISGFMFSPDSKWQAFSDLII